ncbi:bifunctional enoyl-CoA hydratase/phosphate acetyltransferase [Methylocella sp.]|uniref:bifunctional enoyl-CoA hydratase/phosphate acetyltransferase n=1 Tax=Methylocella sp. TaxID=1978226 RepID=UPI0037840FB2
MTSFSNRLIGELRVGDAASTQRTIHAGDRRAWATAFGDAASGSGADAAIGIASSLLAALVGAKLPGPGSAVRKVSAELAGDLPVDVPLTVALTVKEVHAADGTVTLAGRLTAPDGAVVAVATILAQPASVKTTVEIVDHSLDALLERCRSLKPMPTGVVHPLNPGSLSGALEAAAAGLIVPVLYGPEAAIRKLAETAGIDLGATRIVDTKDEADSAAQAAAAAGAGELRGLMKGSLHTDILLHAVLAKESGLRAGRLLSHCAAISTPSYGRRIFLTDVALNIAPDLDQKRDIVQNAIGFAKALGIETPKVGVLAAVEVVHSRMTATTDAAALAKMADRGQIVGGLVDGPFDLDAAVDAAAARTKHIVSPVAGVADVLVAPNIEAGNMIYKDLVFMADAQSAGLVVGARVPVMLTSRADAAAARRYSAAAAALYADALERDPDAIMPTTAD